MTGMKDAFEKAGYKNNRNDKMNENRERRSNTGMKANFVKSAELTEDYTLKAEQVIGELRNELGRDYGRFTTSKIRNILSMVNEIYNDVIIEQDEKLNQDLQIRIAYLKVRLVYECGREPRIIKPFVQKANLIHLINGIGDSRKRFIQFSRYMEALVAYHRFYGGKD